MSREATDFEGATVLVVDDIAANREVLGETLEAVGFEVLMAADGEAALKVARKTQPEILLLDIMMPGIDGFETCRRLKADPDLQSIPVLFITANTDLDSVAQGFQVGGVDYITKPFRSEEVLLRVGNHLQISRLTRALEQSNRELRAEIARREQAEDERDHADGRLSVLTARESQRWGIEGLVGQSATFQNILESITKLQPFSSTSVLITGESGTGKELIARAIHFGGPKASGPFIPVNCSAIPKDLAESLFFGHRKGAFSGAVTDSKGYFHFADGGTLFLDEIGDMPHSLQAALLRVLEDGHVRPVGSQSDEKVSVRVVAASNVDFHQAIASGNFRKDLFFRIARFTIEAPPLRERADDIPLLTTHFLRLFAKEMNLPQAQVTDETMALLRDYPYPGNIRELKNLLERAVIESGMTGIIQAEALHFFTPSTTASPPTGAGHPPEPEGSAAEEKTDERHVLDYLQTYGIINNTVCRELLDVDRNRASYVLRKLEKQGHLISEGQGRWAQYRLAP